MKNMLFAGASILFHAGLLCFPCLNVLQKNPVQRGLESIEMEIVIEGLKNGEEIGDRNLLGNFLSMEDQIVSEKDYFKEEIRKEIGEIHKILREKSAQKKRTNQAKNKRSSVNNEKPEKNLTEITSQSLKVRSSLHSGAWMHSSESVLANPSPKYPRLAILKGWEGEALVRIRINTNGEVGSLSMIKSSGYTVLDESVIQTLQAWRFEKGFVREIDIPVKFVLKSGSALGEKTF